MKAIMIFSIALFLSGCSSTPWLSGGADEKQGIDHATFSVGYNTAWESVVSWFGDHNVVIDKIEKDSGIITAKYKFSAFTNALDCPQAKDTFLLFFNSSPDNYVSKMMTLNVIVRKEDDRTLVKVNVFGDATLYGDTGNPIDRAKCYSTGLVEQSILSEVSKNETGTKTIDAPKEKLVI